MPETTLQRIEERPDVESVTRMRLALGTTIPELLDERLEDIRTELIDAMKLVDSSEHRDLHVATGELVNRLDRFRAVLAERSAS